ncbi:endonuclease/exonuclease/phosphatase family protein [Streptomyces sp. NPDC056682]|uniref:endonuclease/exonuclease/phosphatase family protein n=1 Tax=Streptomyces sp. NPDC056682 TaxID=3345909 RepID=UPI0036C52617
MARRLPQLIRRALALAWKVNPRAAIALLVCQAASGVLEAFGLLATSVPQTSVLFLIRRALARGPSAERSWSVQTVRIANFNAYKLNKTARGTTAWKARVTTVQEIAPAILSLQEVLVDHSTAPNDRWDTEAADTIHSFAADCGLTATVTATSGYPHGTVMASNSNRPWYTAILWNPDLVGLVPGSYRPYGAPDFWHGLTTAQFDLGAGEPVTVASYHGDPIRPDGRYNEALRIKSIFRRTAGVKRGFVIGDFNALSAARRAPHLGDGGSGSLGYYDAEPYGDQDHDDLEFQLLADTVGKEQLADRRQSAALLRRGFMVDAAAHLGAPWEATVGYWEDGRGDPDPWGERRIDLILATRPTAPGLVGYRLHRTAAALEASDHLCPVVDVSADAFTEGC